MQLITGDWKFFCNKILNEPRYASDPIMVLGLILETTEKDNGKYPGRKIRFLLHNLVMGPISNQEFIFVDLWAEVPQRDNKYRREEYFILENTWGLLDIQVKFWWTPIIYHKIIHWLTWWIREIYSVNRWNQEKYWASRWIHLWIILQPNLRGNVLH